MGPSRERPGARGDYHCGSRRARSPGCRTRRCVDAAQEQVPRRADELYRCSTHRVYPVEEDIGWHEHHGPGLPGIEPRQRHVRITDNHWRDDSPYRIYNSEVHLNSTISWNDSLAFGVINTSDGPICRADARKVMTHEIGHAQGLGHTGVDPAVMRQGGTTYWRPQPNDKDGLQAIYGAAP